MVFSYWQLVYNYLLLLFYFPFQRIERFVGNVFFFFFFINQIEVLIISEKNKKEKKGATGVLSDFFFFCRYFFVFSVPFFLELHNQKKKKALKEND